MLKSGFFFSSVRFHTTVSKVRVFKMLFKPIPEDTVAQLPSHTA